MEELQIRELHLGLLGGEGMSTCATIHSLPGCLRRKLGWMYGAAGTQIWDVDIQAAAQLAVSQQLPQSELQNRPLCWQLLVVGILG